SGAIALPVAVLGTLLALIGAASLSPLLPFGVARKADIDAGFHVDALVFTLGALALVAIVTLIGTVAGFRVAQTGTARSSLRPSTAARIAEGVGVAPTVAAGMRLALEPGRARTAVPVRSAFFGAAFGVLGVVAILIFSSSLDHLAATPKLYGWTFDAVVTPETQLSTSAAVE